MDLSSVQKNRQSILLLLIPKFYHIGIKLYGTLIRLAALKNKKAKLWLEGRKHTFCYLEEHISIKDDLIWIHAPSLGEFEQARPLIEALKLKHNKYKILLTFYSPSGYEVRKEYPLADYICYLPLDTQKNARRFLEVVQPNLTFFVKYDFWANYLNELQNRGLKHYVISAIFRENHYFFKNKGTWMLELLSKVDHFFVQNENSKALLNTHKINRVSTTGDTRFDRVATISKKNVRLPIVEHFKGKTPLFVAGSTWAKGEALIVDLINHFETKFKYVIAPHEINETQIVKLENKLHCKTIRYSQANLNNSSNAQVLIIDNIGLLSSLYTYADVTYIGGGFGRGIHNILEAATFGMPIYIGPKNEKFQEAKDLKELGVAVEINSSKELIAHCTLLLSEPAKWEKLKSLSKQYVESKTGASEKIIEFVLKSS